VNSHDLLSAAVCTLCLLVLHNVLGPSFCEPLGNWLQVLQLQDSTSTGAALKAKARPLRTDLSIASGNFILEFSSINSRSRLFSRWCMRASPRGLWSRRQVWLARMHQRDACWAGEVSLTGLHIATLGNSSPVSRYLYIDL